MNRPRRSVVNVDDLSRQVSVEQVLSHFGLLHEIIHRTGSEIRSRCFLNCGKMEPTGDRVLAIRNDGVKQWCCHRYECPHKAGGNLVSLVDLLLHGANAGGRPRGERFKEVLKTIQAIAGDTGSAAKSVSVTAHEPPPPEPPKINVPLAESSNERARGLVNLHEKFIVDPAQMNPTAASYFRRRPYLTSELAGQWRMGYLARDTGGDASGGTMRGKIVYQLDDEQGRIIGYCGRDPDFERKHTAWLSGGRQGTEPVKVTFPKGLHRGLLLYGEHRLREPAIAKQARALGMLLVVEGPNDVIRLSQFGVPALAICSNRMTAEQVEKLVRWADELGSLSVTLLFDLDPEGEAGMQQAVWELAQRCPVRVAWSRTMHDGKFRDRQPESLKIDDWQQLTTAWNVVGGVRGQGRGDTPAA